MKNLVRTAIMATIALAVSVTIHAAPANDDWNNATQVGGLFGGLSGTVAGATLQGCEAGVHTFPDEGQTLATKTVWYKFFVPANGSYTFRFLEDETTINTVVSAYRMQLVLCDGNLMQVPYRVVENNKYNSAFAPPNQKGRITFGATAGEFIYISVDTYNGADGQFTLLWGKTRFRYDTQLDHCNGGADLAVARPSIFSATQWWTARYSNTAAFGHFGNKLYGQFNDRTFMADYDGDGLADMVAVRQTDLKLVWWISNRDGQVIKVVEFGLNTDKPIVGDYDGDGIADIAVTRDDPFANTKTWHILRSSDGQYTGMQFGLASDREMVGDYDADGKTDVVALRPENGTLRWYILKSATNQVMTRVFGNDFGDIPQTVDFDGDGATDIAVFRQNHPAGGTAEYDGYWFSIDSNSPTPIELRQIRFQKFGEMNDVPQAADFDGDLRTDLAVYRGGQWWVRKSRTGQIASYSFGNATDIPMADGGQSFAQRF